MSDIRINLKIPAAFAQSVISERGDLGKDWLEQIPNMVSGLLKSWRLSINGQARHGHLGLVIPVLQETQELVLKITWPDESVQHEILALKAWAGNGAVQLLASCPEAGAILLEKLDANRTLADPSISTDEAVQIAARLLGRLAVPYPDTDANRDNNKCRTRLPSLVDHAARLPVSLTKRLEKLNRPFPKQYLDAAIQILQEIGPHSKHLLVDHDLHYGNVLASRREPWLVIDPKPIVGDKEFGVAPLVWRRPEHALNKSGLLHRIILIADVAELDRRLACQWTLVRSVDYWLWALSVGLTEDPNRMRLIVDCLLANS